MLLDLPEVCIDCIGGEDGKTTLVNDIIDSCEAALMPLPIPLLPKEPGTATLCALPQVLKDADLTKLFLALELNDSCPALIELKEVEPTNS